MCKGQEDWRRLYEAVSGKLTPGRFLESVRHELAHWAVRWTDSRTGVDVRRIALVPFDEWPNPDSADGCGLILFCEKWLEIRGLVP